MLSVVCVKWGKKYNAKHVNDLYEQCKKHLNLDFTMYCYTDNSNMLHPDIKTIPITEEYDGVWNKLKLFDYDLGKTLYLDLDTHIHNDIDELVKSSFTMVKCYWKPIEELEDWDHNINSSIMYWEGLENKHIYDMFASDPEYYMLKYYGIDHFIYKEGFKSDFYKLGLVYSRMCGYDEDDWHNPKRNWYWHPEALVCMFNGPIDPLSSFATNPHEELRTSSSSDILLG